MEGTLGAVIAMLIHLCATLTTPVHVFNLCIMLYSENDLEDDIYDHVTHGANGRGDGDDIYEDIISEKSARKRRSRIASVKDWLKWSE